MKQTPEFKSLAGITHGFFTRQDGVSEGVYASLNCGPGSKDNPAHVEKNRAAALQKLGLPHAQLCTLYQCHSSDVVVIKNGHDFIAGIKADALVTDQKNYVLGILTADCAPVLFADTTKNIIGAAHAGWRGALGGILENTVAAMFDLGATHANISACIGPCIGPKSYEVGDDFRQTFLNDDSENHTFFTMLPKKAHYLFDLPGYIKARLEKLGLKSVKWIGEDTLPNDTLYFSYRRTCLRKEADYGRQLSAIALTL